MIDTVKAMQDYMAFTHDIKKQLETISTINDILRGRAVVEESTKEMLQIMNNVISLLCTEIKDWENAAEQCGAYFPCPRGLVMAFRNLQKEIKDVE